MKQLNKLFFLLLGTFLVTSLSAQERFMDEVFTEVNVQSNQVYGSNISVLQAPTIAPIDLLMDVYTPVGDSITNRPVVVYFHTGSFLPAIFNGQVTGAKEDSTAAEICRRLARQGYVAISATYRQGWNPTAVGAEGQNIRTGTLLNAAYRGSQDARTLIRYLRKTVAEDGNPHGVDPDRICLWGQGTGGYISYAAAYLNDFSEIVLPKFIDTETLQVYVDSSLSGGVDGLELRPLNLPNWPGYSSRFKLAVNAGGALGDISWVDGTAEEPATIGFHVLRDPFAPFGRGNVIVPVTGDFVVEVVGTRTVTGAANDLGLNSVFETVNADLTDPINALNQVYKSVPVAFPTDTTTLSTDNMFPFVTGDLASGPWEWWGLPQLTATVAGLNMFLGTEFDAMELDSTNRLLNPDMSKEKAMRYIDTMMAFFNPRAYLALDLATVVTNTKEVLTAADVQMKVGPNPVQAEVFIQTAPDKPMKNVALYHMNGKMLRGMMNVNSSTYTLQRGNLPPGIYLLQAQFKEGVVSKKLVFK